MTLSLTPREPQSLAALKKFLGMAQSALHTGTTQSHPVGPPQQMTALNHEAAQQVATYLAANIPREREGWSHKSMSAYEIGCMALVALGQATESAWGAIPNPSLKLPETLPRWDDLCVAVLKLAAQQIQISYRQPNGDAHEPEGHWVVKVLGAPPPPPPNIQGAYGLGPALADKALLPVLDALGLIDPDQRWTQQAETILWRIQPRAWSMSVPSDTRFLDAAKRAIESLPNDTRTKIDALVTITEDDIAAHLAAHAKAQEETRAKYGPQARLGPARTPDQARRSLQFLRRNDLDWLFFRHWRLPDGWLDGKGRGNALEIFHDPLAIQMRKAVTERLYPERPSFAE